MRDGESMLTPLEIDMFGEIRNWPNDFFGDLLGEWLQPLTPAWIASNCKPMDHKIVDTNVPLTAAGQNDAASKTLVN